MVDIFRRYWIAGLVLLLVIIHGGIIGYIRSQASRLQTTASREFSLGEFTLVSADKSHCTRFQIHAVLPHSRRFAGRSTLQQNYWMIHEAIEQHLRQIEPALLRDPAMIEIKNSLKKVVDERLGEPLVEQLLITNLLELPIDRLNVPAYTVNEDLVQATNP
jgi:hypothetical protein